jgi:hypothetical protein
MINKKALIFGYPGEKEGRYYCAGVSGDMSDYYSHFKSLYGGAWKEDEEVFIEEQPITKDLLKEYIEYFNSEAEYSVFIFVGHGRYHKDYGTIIQLNAREEVSEFELLLNDVTRQLNILDCCRVQTISQMQGHYLKESYNESFSASNIELYRKCYNALLKDSIEGVINIYSCKAGEKSKDRRSFSYQLLHNAKGNEALSIYKAFKKAEPIVQRESSNKQNPVFDGPRMRGNPFPFYIKL